MLRTLRIEHVTSFGDQTAYRPDLIPIYSYIYKNLFYSQIYFFEPVSSVFENGTL